MAVVETQKINYSNLREIISNAKTAISTRFNVSVDNIKNLNQNGTSNTSDGLDGFFIWLGPISGYRVKRGLVQHSPASIPFLVSL